MQFQPMQAMRGHPGPGPSLRPKLLGLGFIAVLLMAGCGDPERQKLVGTWVAETPDRVERRVDGPGSDPTEKPTMLVRFGWNGTLETLTQMGDIQRSKSGRWELLEADPIAGTATLECTLGDSRSPAQTTTLVVEWVDEQTLRMTPPNLAGLDLPMNFQRESQ